MTADPEQIRRRIEHTRSTLSAHVNALTEKVTPSRAMARQVDRTRHTMTNVKDKIMGTAEDAASTAADAVSTIGETASSVVSTTADQVSSMTSSSAGGCRAASSFPRFSPRTSTGVRWRRTWWSRW